MVNKGAVGQTGEAFDLVVERGKVREFARATKSQSPEYLADPVPVSPPTFLVSSVFWAPPGAARWGDLQLDMRRVLDGGREFVFHGPPPAAGTQLTSLGSVCPAPSHAFCRRRGRSRRIVQFGTQRNLHDARRLAFRNKWSDQCTREIARLQRWVRNVRQMSMRSSSRLLPKRSGSIQMS